MIDFSITVKWKDENGEITDDTTLPLDTTYITDIANWKQEIEKNLFEFVNDDISFTILRHSPDADYFDPDNFIENLDRIYRLDLEFTINNDTKKLIFFVNKDSATRTRSAESDEIKVSGYELSALFKDEGWMLGELVQNEDDDEAYYQFLSNNLLTLSEITGAMQTNVESIIDAKNIPINSGDNDATFEISEISPSEETAEGDFDFGDETIMDIWQIPEEVDGGTVPEEWASRIFVITKVSKWKYHLWEVSGNGLTLTDTFTIPEYCSIGSDDTAISVAFIHHFETFSGVSHLVITTIQFRYFWMQVPGHHPPQIPAFANYQLNLIYGFDDDNELHFVEEDEWGGINYSPQTLEDWILPRRNCYINTEGFPETDGDIDNFLQLAVINEWNIVYPSACYYSAYSISSISSGPSNTYDYNTADFLHYSVTPFPVVLKYNYKDKTFGEILRDICITQDIAWYISYAGGNIKIEFAARIDVQSDVGINPKNVISEKAKIKKIKFSDLKCQLFSQSKNRLELLREYYDDKYGNGKYELDLALHDHQDWQIGTIIEHYDNPAGTPKNWFLKKIEWDIFGYETNVILFEI